MSWPCGQDCVVWVEASKCVGNASTFRVFVHEDDLPASTKIFAFDSQDSQVNCWTINPAASPICLPQERGVYVYNGGFPHDTCAACEASGGDTAGGLPAGGGPGGNFVGPPFGTGGDPNNWPGGGATPQGIKVTVCSDHVARATARGWNVNSLYVPATDTRPSSRVYDLSGVCITVPTGPIVTNPTDATWVGLAGDNFATCNDCARGVEATLCVDDAALPNAADAPEVWIRSEDLADAPTGFEFRGWCYEKSTTPLGVIPEDAIRLKPTGDGETCITCNIGLRYQLCAGELETDTEYWAPQDDISAIVSDYPAKSTIYMRIEGRCYSLDLIDFASRIPTDAVVIAPRCQYDTCNDCACGGEPDSVCAGLVGVPVRLCGGQNSARWQDTWMPTSKKPSKRTFFSRDGFCVFVDPREDDTPIPEGARILNSINNEYPNCHSCLGWAWPGGPGGGGGGGGGGAGGGDIGGNPDPPPARRGTTGLPCYFRLYECDAGMTNKYILAACDTLIGAVKLKDDPACYGVVHPGKKAIPAAGTQVLQVDEQDHKKTGGVAGCGLYGRYDCGPLYYLRECPANNYPADVFKNTRTDLAADVGKVVEVGGNCYKVFAGDLASHPIGSVTVTNRSTTCGECDTCTAGVLTCTECDDVTPSSYTVVISGISLCTSCFGYLPVDSQTIAAAGAFNPNGSFLLPQTSGCVWALNITNAVTVERFFTDDCTGAKTTTTDNVILRLTKTAATFKFTMETQTTNLVLFEGEANAIITSGNQVCETLPTINRSDPSGACGDELPSSTRDWAATGGTITGGCT